MSAPEPRCNPLLIGHAAAEASFRAALGGRLHHAWLITGPEGVGKATLAYRFARALLGGSAAAFPEAPAFRRIATGSHADLLTVEREWDEKKKRMKKQVSAESVRDIPKFLQLTPAEGGWRVVILDGAEDVNAFSANALLKVLEEPPQRAILILVCTAPGRLLPTIRSRCRHLPLAPLSAEEMERALALYLPERTGAERQRLAALAEGSPGRALMLAEGGGLAVQAMVDEVVATPNLPVGRAYEMADRLRDQQPFEMFGALLQQALARAVKARAKGLQGAEDLLNGKPLAAWAEVFARLSALFTETEALNMDRRQAVVASLDLLKG